MTGGRRDTTMRVLAWTVLAASLAACLPIAAMTRDDVTVAGVTIVTVDDHDDLVEGELAIEAWLDEGKRVALTGPASMLGVLKPDRVYAWPATDTVVLDPAVGLGIFGFNAIDSAHRVQVLKNWAWAERAEDGEIPGRDIRSAE